MLVLLREFGREQLEQHEEIANIQQAPAATYLALAETTSPHLDEPEQAGWLGQLVQEHDNLRAALRWALDQGDVDSASRLGVALWPYWVKQGYLSEGLRLLEQILAISDSRFTITALETAGDAQSSVVSRQSNSGLNYF